LNKNTITGIILIGFLIIGLLYPLITMQVYVPHKEANFKSLVKTIYNTIIENILAKSNTTTTLILNNEPTVFKIRSSIVKMYSSTNKDIEVKLVSLENIPSDYMLFNETNKQVLLIIGYYVEVALPSKIKYLEVDGKLSYISVILENISYSYMKAGFLGSIVELTLENGMLDAAVIRLDESLMEAYINNTQLNFTGELSLEFETYTSILYAHVNIDNSTKVRVIRENIGGVEEVNINGSRLYEYYYVDPEYYESSKRLHIALKGFGSGIRIDLNRIG